MAKYIEKEKIEQMKYLPPDFLQPARKSSGKPTYVCPCCQSGTGKNGTGIIQLPDGKWYCFAEQKPRDIFDLVAISQGLSSFAECAEWLADREGIRIEDPAPAYERRVVVEEPEVSQLDYIQKVRNSNYDYLLKRGISEETQKKFWVGYDPDWVHPKIASNPKAPRTPRCIIPTSKTSYLARDTRDNVPDYQRNYTKSKVGKVHIFNEKVLEAIDKVDKDFSVVHDSSDLDKLFNYLNTCNLFIVEGEIDAMSIIDNGTQAIGLGSASNVHHLLKTLDQKNYSLGNVFFCRDNDFAGVNAMETFVDGAKKLGLDIKEVVPVQVPERYKDVNEFLVKDRAGFKQWLADCQRPVMEKEIAAFIEAAERSNVDISIKHEFKEKIKRKDMGMSL